MQDPAEAPSGVTEEAAGERGGVRGGDHAGVADKRAVGRIRLLGVDVEAEGAEVAGPDGAQGGLVVEQAAAETFTSRAPGRIAAMAAASMSGGGPAR